MSAPATRGAQQMRRAPGSVRRISSSSVLGQAPVFRVERGQGIERSYLGRRTLEKIHRYRELPQHDDPANSLVTADRHFGARVVRLASVGSGNKLDLPMVRALRKHLERLEQNPSVTIVIIQGQTDGIFSTGTDMVRLKALAGGEGRYAGSSAEARMVALQHLQEQYRLHHLIATYSKPIVAGMTGSVQGSAWALGNHAAYSYVSDNSSVQLPEVAAGLVPHGGASYYLSRVPDGVGMYAALTGAAISGHTAYWAGLGTLYGSVTDVRETLVTEAGDHSADVTCNTDLQRDPVYIKAMAAVRMYRGDDHYPAADEGDDDLSAEMYEEYFRLKRWYQHWSAGDQDGAQAILEEDDEGALWEPASDGDYYDAYRGADSRRQLYPSRFGETHHGSYENAPATAAAERRARIGAVSAHAAAIFRGELGSGPSNEAVAQLGVIRRAFGSGPNDTPTLVTQGAAPSSAQVHQAAVDKVVAAAQAVHAASAEPGRDLVLDRAWMERLPAAPGRAGLRQYLLGTAEKAGLCHDVDLAGMGLHNAQKAREASLASGTPADQAPAVPDLSMVSVALPPVGTDVAVELTKLCVEQSWPSGQLQDDDWADISENVLGEGWADRLAKSPAAATAAGIALPTASQLESNLEDLMRLVTARVTAAMHGVPAWSLAEPDVIKDVSTRNARVVASADGRADGQAIQGPSGYTVPAIPKVMVDDEEVDGYNEVLPVNPRLFSDPEGLIEMPAEDDEDTMWAFHQGSWMGDKDNLGENDSSPIFPENALGLRKNTRFDAVGSAVDTLRGDVLRMLNAGLGSGVYGAYINKAASYSVTSQDAAEGERDAKKALARLRSAMLGPEGLATLDKLVRQYSTREGGDAQAADVEVPGSAKQRAMMKIAWPQMQASLLRMRVLIFRAMAETNGYPLSDEDAEAMARAKVDTLEGRKALQHKADTFVEPGALRLVKLWVELVEKSTPSSRPLDELDASAKAAAAADPASKFAKGKLFLPTALPKIMLPDAEKAKLTAAADQFAAWEGIVLGRGAGGTWTVASTAQPKRRVIYTLAWTLDKESGAKRLTLQRKSAGGKKITKTVVTPAPVGAVGTGTTSVGAGKATAGSAASSSPASASDEEFDAISGLAEDEFLDSFDDVFKPADRLPPARDVAEARRALAAVDKDKRDELEAVLKERVRFNEKVAVEDDDEGGAFGAGEAGPASPLDALASGRLPAVSKPSSPAPKSSDASTADEDGLSSALSSMKLNEAEVEAEAEAELASEAGEVDTEMEDVEDAKKAIMSRAGPDGNLPYRQATLGHKEATAVARAVGLVWDWDTVRDALADRSGESLVKLFSLPTTGRTLGTGAMVADYFRREADGRLAPRAAQSVDEIMDRLAQEASGRPFGKNADAFDAAKARKLDERSAARGARKQYGAVAAAFAAESLAQMKAQPAGALRATHALLLQAGTLSLADSMSMEYRAMARLMGLAPGPSGAQDSYDPSNASIDTKTLFEPLPAGMELQLEGGGFSRSKATAVRKEREDAQARWEAALEEYLASGEAAGVVGDMFRRRYLYTPPSITGVVQGNLSNDEEVSEDDATGLVGTIAQLYKEDEAAREAAGQLPAIAEAEDNVDKAELAVDADTLMDMPDNIPDEDLDYPGVDPTNELPAAESMSEDVDEVAFMKSDEGQRDGPKGGQSGKGAGKTPAGLFAQGQGEADLSDEDDDDEDAGEGDHPDEDLAERTEATHLWTTSSMKRVDGELDKLAAEAKQARARGAAAEKARRERQVALAKAGKGGIGLDQLDRAERARWEALLGRKASKAPKPPAWMQ